MRPSSRNKRVLRNAGLKRITRTPDERPTGQRERKEEWVIRCVTRVVGTKAGRGFVTADDVASDVILELYNAGGFHWEEEEIEAYCRRRSAYIIRHYLSRREKNECEFYSSATGQNVPIIDMADCADPQQMIVFDASMARRCLQNIPSKQRAALEILCDGGNPIDVAEELGIKPWEAIALIREGREFITRVDPAHE